MALADGGDADTTWVRYTYNSLTTPTTTYETDLKTGERKLLKRQPCDRLRPVQLCHRTGMDHGAGRGEGPGLG